MLGRLVLRAPLAAPPSQGPQPLPRAGLNDHGITVGFYSHTNNKDQATNASFGFYAVRDSTCGFTLTLTGGFRIVNGPKGLGSTIISGVSDAGDLVGFCNGKNGNTNGMLAIP